MKEAQHPHLAEENIFVCAENMLKDQAEANDSLVLTHIRQCASCQSRVAEMYHLLLDMETEALLDNAGAMHLSENAVYGYAEAIFSEQTPALKSHERDHLQDCQDCQDRVSEIYNLLIDLDITEQSEIVHPEEDVLFAYTEAICQDNPEAIGQADFLHIQECPVCQEKVAEVFNLLVDLETEELLKAQEQYLMPKFQTSTVGNMSKWLRFANPYGYVAVAAILIVAFGIFYLYILKIPANKPDLIPNSTEIVEEGSKQKDVLNLKPTIGQEQVVDESAVPSNTITPTNSEAKHGVAEVKSKILLSKEEIIKILNNEFAKSFVSQTIDVFEISLAGTRSIHPQKTYQFLPENDWQALDKVTFQGTLDSIDASNGSIILRIYKTPQEYLTYSLPLKDRKFDFPMHSLETRKWYWQIFKDESAKVPLYTGVFQFYNSQDLPEHVLGR